MTGARLDTEAHSELMHEQRYIERAYACLERMHERAVHLKSLGYMGGNVTEGGVAFSTPFKA